jgi:7,8-dihydropterin-6-yl-methyl-4-(beta-D-ribofuranosyl)aminobenzene 5'-phosphate synthase
MNQESRADGAVQLDELEILVVVDNETDTLSSVDDGVPQVPEVVHLAARTPPSRIYEGHECKTVFDQLCCACHGLSVLITGRLDGQQHRMLFDVGPYPELIAAIGEARSAAGLPPPVVDLHPDRPDQRGILLPSGVMVMLPLEPTIEDMARAGGDTVTHDDPRPICDRFFFGSGAIDRVTDYETGLAGHHTFRGEDGEPDPLIMDERFVAACVRGRGVTVFSACSHAGIVNACLGAQQHFPDTPIDVVLGGFHLAGKAMEARIEPTIRDLEATIEPRLVAPGHCTGWRAKARLADTFAPGRYAPSVVGTLYRLSAVAT